MQDGRDGHRGRFRSGRLGCRQGNRVHREGDREQKGPRAPWKACKEALINRGSRSNGFPAGHNLTTKGADP